MSAHTASKLASQLRTTEGASVSDFVMEPEANGGEAGRGEDDLVQRVSTDRGQGGSTQSISLLLKQLNMPSTTTATTTNNNNA